jgi:TP901 family phage tail tape measure protein
MAYDLVARLRLIDDMSSPLRRATAQMTQAGRVGRTSFSGVSSALGAVATGLGIVTTAAAGVAAAFSSVNKVMDFEAQLSSIKALTGASSAEMEQMSKLALDMGAQTKYSALEAAQGIEELLKSGLTPAQVQAGGLESALNLATAGSLGLADAAEIMSTALNAYKRDALSAEQASNILAGTANASATSVQELRYSLAMVSAVAAGVGMTFKDTNTALGLFANNGLKGSDAGTSLKTMLSNLQPTTKEQIALFKKLGLMTQSGANAFFDAKGKLKSLEEIAGILRKSLSGLTDQQRMMALETMFGSDAIRAATILFNEGSEGVRKFQAEMTKVSALDVAKEKMNNAAGAVEQFKGAIETLQIAALTPLMPKIKEVALAAADATERFTKWLGTREAKEWGDTLINILSIVGPLIGGVTAAWVAYRTAIGIATAAQWAFNIAANANPLGLIVVAIGLVIGAGYLLVKHWDTIKQAASDLWVTLKNAFAKGVNWVIGHLNKMIDAMNKVLEHVGITIPQIPEVALDYSVQQREMEEFRQKRNLGIDGSHAGGLSYVPYDGYVARLHKGERVLTSAENEQYTNGGGGGVHIAKLADQIVVREDADIDRIAMALARELRRLM